MGTVTRLPTAARRKIDNFRYADQRRAVCAARTATPWPGEYKFPREREREAKSAYLQKLQRTPELAALLAIMTAFPEDRLDALEGAANLLALRDPEGESAQLGAMLVRDAVATRRALMRIAKMEG